MNSRMPYPGLRPFRRDEVEIFFGREEHTDQLLDKLRDSSDSHLSQDKQH